MKYDRVSQFRGLMRQRRIKSVQHLDGKIINNFGESHKQTEYEHTSVCSVRANERSICMFMADANEHKFDAHTKTEGERESHKGEYFLML